MGHGSRLTAQGSWLMANKTLALPLTIHSRLINELCNAMFRSLKVSKFQSSKITSVQDFKIPIFQKTNKDTLGKVRSPIANCLLFEISKRILSQDDLDFIDCDSAENKGSRSPTNRRNATNSETTIN